MSEESKTPRADEPDDLAGAIGGFIDRKKARIAELETELSAANARIAEMEKDRVASQPAPMKEGKRIGDFTWQCAQCGTLNGLHREGCRECGLSIYKSQAAESATPPAERPTPITDEMLWQYDHLGPNWLATEILGPFARNLERQLAEARKQRDTAMRRANKIAAEALALTEQRGALAEALEKTAKDFITFRNIARENGIVGTIGLESLELAAAALAAINPDTPS